MKIDKYILVDNLYNPVYKTFDLVDLAREIEILNKRITYINSHREYKDRKIFNYKLIVEKVELKEVE